MVELIYSNLNEEVSKTIIQYNDLIIIIQYDS